MIRKIKSFSLKQKDFSTGKMVSPCKSEWINCCCCGKLIVQGVEMSNGDKIGNDCFEIVQRVQTAIKCFNSADKVFNMFSPKQCVISYALESCK